jgi:hypothetical protein
MESVRPYVAWDGLRPSSGLNRLLFASISRRISTLMKREYGWARKFCTATTTPSSYSSGVGDPESSYPSHPSWQQLLRPGKTQPMSFLPVHQCHRGLRQSEGSACLHRPMATTSLNSLRANSRQITLKSQRIFHFPLS